MGGIGGEIPRCLRASMIAEVSIDRYTSFLYPAKYITATTITTTTFPIYFLQEPHPRGRTSPLNRGTGALGTLSTSRIDRRLEST